MKYDVAKTKVRACVSTFIWRELQASIWFCVPYHVCHFSWINHLGLIENESSHVRDRLPRNTMSCFAGELYDYDYYGAHLLPAVKSEMKACHLLVCFLHIIAIICNFLAK